MSLGKRLAAGATPEEAEAVRPVDFAHREMVLARATKLWAVRVDTRESIEIGALHEGLLENRWSLWRGLHTTRHLLSIGVMITGHYQPSLALTPVTASEDDLTAGDMSVGLGQNQIHTCQSEVDASLV
jgi:hypothetical protein